MNPTKPCKMTTLVTLFLGIALAMPVGSAFAQKVQVKPGDRVGVVSVVAELRLGKQVVTTLSKGQQLKTTKVQGQWVYCTLEVEGEK